MVSPLHCDGSSRRGDADRDGGCFDRGHRRKERTNPELVGNRARLVVFAKPRLSRGSTRDRSGEVGATSIAQALLSRRGVSGGCLSFLVRLPTLSPCFCWICAGTCLCRLKWRATADNAVEGRAWRAARHGRSTDFSQQGFCCWLFLRTSSQKKSEPREGETKGHWWHRTTVWLWASCTQNHASHSSQQHCRPSARPLETRKTRKLRRDVSVALTTLQTRVSPSPWAPRSHSGCLD